MDTLELSQQKANLRKAMKPIRRDAKAENPDAEVALIAHLSQFFSSFQAKNVEKAPLFVGGYAPIQSEFPLWNVMKNLEAEGHHICLPLVEGANTPLTFLSWQTNTPLIDGAFGAKTPHPKTAIKVKPDVLLVPLLAYDDKGYRLGYGGGFYDRSIALYKPKLTVGIAYSAQRVDLVPIGRYDLALTCIATEKGLAVPPSSA